jgi:16S rRNA (adenine1518-N6/adenine1519-N6)-dimethyltransferase
MLNLASPAVVRDLLRRYAVRPSKRRGQNFLIDRNALERVVAAGELKAGDGVLEIGPGLGALTREIAARCRRVVAVEIDRRLADALERETLSGCDNVEVVRADFLALDLRRLLDERLGAGRHKVLANIPYAITSPVIARLLEHRERLEGIVLMVQREVAARLAAPPGSEHYGSLTLLAAFYTQVELIGNVSRRCFVPAPEVDSAIVRLRILAQSRAPDVDPACFFAIVHASFQQRRKNLLNSLSGSPNLGWSRERVAEVLARAGIDPARRGETLSVEEFAALARSSR